MVYCAAVCCSNDSRTARGVSFFKLLSRSKKAKREWLVKLQRENFVPSKHTVVCAKHFAPDAFERDLQGELLGQQRPRKLKPDAVPTIFQQKLDGKQTTRTNIRKLKETPSDQQLHLAALQGNIEQLRRVLDSGKVHVDCKDKEGTTPLILAAANSHIECVRELLKQGADGAARRLTGTCALFFAAQGGFLDIVRLLLDSGVPVDIPSYDGGTPLFVACQCNHMQVVKELLEHGADIHAQMVDGATPLFITSQNGHHVLLKFLISQGADVNMPRKDNATPVWIAAQMGHTSIVNELLGCGANVDAVREDGATPLFKACHKGHLSVVEELLRGKPSLGVLKNGETALHAAALFGHMKVTRVLMANGADKSLKNKEGQTAAELAREAGYDYIAKFIEGFSLSNSVKPTTNGAT